jgi:hypothetical protein
MRSFFICVAALAFLGSELIGLLQGLSTMALLTRSVVVFAAFFVFGQFFCLFLQKTQPVEEVIQDNPILGVQAGPEADSNAVKKEEIIRQAVGNPKQTAHVINTLISE